MTIYIYASSDCKINEPGFYIEAYSTLEKAIASYPGEWRQTSDGIWEICEESPYDYLIKEVKLDPNPYE
ncbi:MAG: hypothetical protein HWQ38_24075 [Nostoc sp. NMS7]|uniref:hypothetical protein n=1 Tax=Nostoc sp. NMS7 TaxID=2815391 RepID=UPI0025DCC911|nr:hypothetical protein [Nostoc sp. NMS7]MBN3949371.1 hypothetical protein [Nostoc sp. NMS7]